MACCFIIVDRRLQNDHRPALQLQSRGDNCVRLVTQCLTHNVKKKILLPTLYIYSLMADSPSLEFVWYGLRKKVQNSILQRMESCKPQFMLTLENPY